MTIRFFRRRLLAAVAPLLLVACNKELDTMYEEVGPQFPTFVSNTLGTQAKYAPGEMMQFELQFAQQTARIREIRLIEKLEQNADSAVVQTIPYKPAFSRRRQADTLVVNYRVPQGANKSRVRLHAILVAENDQTKARTIAFRLAEATPTIRLNSTTNVTAPAGEAPVAGDVVRFNLLLNQNGITSYPELPATPPAATSILYKDLDSLVTYVRIGSAAERRAQKAVRLPAAGAQSGAQSSVNVDVVIPANSSGQVVQYRFEVKSRYQENTPPAAAAVRSATTSAAPITPGTATALPAARPVTLSYTGTTGGDQAALDLTTLTTVTASSSAATKDVAITSTASNAVRLQSLNATATPAVTATRFVRVASGGAALYNSGTLNSIRQAYLNTAAASQLTTLDNVVVGDVVIARVRGLNQYAIFTVTGINRTATDVTLSLAVKTL
jgi:hypothetical protein